MDQKILCLFLLITIWSVTDAQFLYNYEDDDANDPPPSSEKFDASLYKYNPPSAVEQHFLQSQSVNPAPRDPEPVYRQYTPKIEYQNNQYEPEPQPAPRNYRTEPEYFDDDDDDDDDDDEYIPASPPPPRRRMTRRRKTIIRRNRPTEITQPPRYYGPSVFENIGLGQAPSGIYVPHDSLLNLLKDDTQTRPQPRHASHASPQHTSVSTRSTQQLHEDYKPSPFFVEPPSEAYSSYVAPPVEHRQQEQNNDDQFYPKQPIREVVQPPQPAYRPSSQEIQQDVYRQQRRVNSARPIQHSQAQTARTHRRRQRPVVQHVPQPQIIHEVPPEPVFDTRATEIFENDVQRFPRRRTEAAPKRRTRTQVNAITPAPQTRQLTTFKPARLAIAELPDDIDEDGIPGEAGQDYPTLHVIPKTSFTCSEQPYNGYYADLETSCQVVHMCHSGGVQSSFLCPNGTIFSQEKFSCQWWYKVDCQNSPRYYSINDSLYKIPPQSKK